MSLTTRGLVALALTLASAWAIRADAEDYPARPVKIVVPYPAGGPSDTAARILAEPLSRQLGQRVIVENRSGGGGMVGTEAVIRGEHDGYTLLVGGLASLVLLPAARSGQYDPMKEVIPLSQIWYSPQVLATRRALGIRSASELVAYAKTNPGKLNFGSAGNGTVTHLAILLLARAAGIEITHVPYRSTALWLYDAIANLVDGGFGDVKTLLPHIESKAIVPLAVTVSERTSQLPNVPTVDEAGLPGVRTENWFGLMALARTPPAILARLKSAVIVSQSDPAYGEALAKIGGMSGRAGSAELVALIEDDVRRFAPIIRSMRKIE